MKKRILSAFLSFCMLLALLPGTAWAAVSASGSCGSNVNWALENGVLTISGSGPMTNFEAKYVTTGDGSSYVVEEVVNTPWYNNLRNSIKEIIIESGVTTIGSWAFLKCEQVTKVTIPSTVTSIGIGAFKICKNLKSIEIPNGVTAIQASTFNGCSSLTNVQLPDSVTRINSYAFAGCEKLTRLTIPDSVASLDKAVFVNAGLIDVTVPAKVTTIPIFAFAGCADLKHIVIPNGVHTIEDEAFEGCGSLPNIEIPASVTSISRSAFKGCTVLSEIRVDTGNPRYASENGVLYTKDRSTLIKCPEGKAGSFSVPDTVTAFEVGAFWHCEKLTSLTIPDSVTDTGSEGSLGVIYGCSALTSAGPLGSGCALQFGWTDSIPTGTFLAAEQLEKIILPDDLFAIQDDMFFYCIGLTSIVIPNKISAIGAHAFSSCSSLTNIDIPGEVTMIGEGAFWGCTSLTNIDIPDKVTVIGTHAFRECTNLTSITIPNGVTDIGSYVFAGSRDVTIYCYKDSAAHQYAKSYNINFVLLDGNPDIPDTPAPTIQSVTLTRESVTSDLLTQTAEFVQGSTEAVAVSAAVDWGGGETGRVFLIQSRDKYVELPATITPGMAFEPDTPIYAVATNIGADKLLDWKLTKLQITEPAPDDLTVALSLYADKSCTNEITSMTNTYGSFSWDKNGSDNSDFDTAYLKLEYTGVTNEGAKTFTLAAPEGFSFYPDVMIGTKEISLWTGSGTNIYPIYPIYSEAQKTELVFAITGSDTKLTIPVNKNSGEGEIYYRDSFDKPGNLALNTWHMKNLRLDGFSRASTQYDHHLAMLSVALSAASYKYDGVRATLRNFGFSNIKTHNSYTGGYDSTSKNRSIVDLDQISKDQNSVASAFATQKYIIDGKIYTIVAVVIRGTVENEWYSNFDIGSGGIHQGFYGAKKDVLDRLASYMDSLQDNGLTADQTKLLITGHSRAAAVADLLTLDLNTAYPGKYAEYEDTYTYTFATPNSMTSVGGSHDNIYNITNYQDIVTHVPGMFYSPGKNLYVNYPGSANYTSARDAFQGYFDELVTRKSLHNPKYFDWGTDALNVIAGLESIDATALINEYGPGLADVALDKALSLNALKLYLRLLLEATESGASTGTDIGKIAGEIGGDPGKVIGGTLGAVIGAKIGFDEGVLAGVTAVLMQKYCTNRIWSNHAIETYMCWMDVLSDGYVYSNALNGAQVKIMCPVDVTVYDENHQIVSQIINNTVVQSTGPYCGVAGDDKIFYLANSDYTFEITGYAAGSMDIEITEYDGEGQKTRFINYADIPVEQNKTVSLVAENCGDTASRYSLATDGGEVEPDHTASGDDIGAVQISVSAEGSGYVIGGGNYTEGERVTLYAVTDNSTFKGWYMDDALVSGERIYQFSAEEDAHITAKFASAPSPGSSSGSSGGAAAHPITVPATTSGPVTNTFNDVSEGAYYYDAVLWAVGNGITTGTSATTFSPDAACTRAQIVTFLWRAAGSPAPESGGNPFTDVSAGAYYYDAVLWAAEQGIANGTSDTTFSPDAACTRAQAVAFLWRAGEAPSVSSGSGFSDVADSAYYANAVKWAVANGVTNGTGDATFSPDADCTRGQIVTFLYRDP